MLRSQAVVQREFPSDSPVVLPVCAVVIRIHIQGRRDWQCTLPVRKRRWKSKEEGRERTAGQNIAVSAVHGSEILVEIKKTGSGTGNVRIKAYFSKICAQLERMRTDKFRVAAVECQRLPINLCRIVGSKRHRSRR